MIQVLIKKKGLLFIPVIIGRQRFKRATKTLRSLQERRENVVESLRTRYKRPQIASSRSVNAVQSQHDRRAIAMIAVHFPIQNMAFWTAISRRSKKKMRTLWDRCESP